MGDGLQALKLVARVMREQAAKIDGEPEIADWLDEGADRVTSFLARVEPEDLGEADLAA